jgi:hypothetical protein
MLETNFFIGSKFRSDQSNHILPISRCESNAGDEHAKIFSELELKEFDGSNVRFSF